MSVIVLRRRKQFDWRAKRRREIEAYARYVGAADTDDLARFLIAWVWHIDSRTKDRIYAVQECAYRLGRKDFSAAEAEAVLEESSITRRCWSADNLARFLGVKYLDRQRLGLTMIGSIDIGKRARKVLRKRNDRLYHERRRRAQGARPHPQSLSQTKPWEAMNMSRRSWYRRRNKGTTGTVGTNSSAAVFLSTSDEVVPLARLRRRGIRGGLRPGRKKEEFVLQTADTMAVDEAVSAYGELPLELRLLALGLSNFWSPKIAAAARLFWKATMESRLANLRGFYEQRI